MTKETKQNKDNEIIGKYSKDEGKEPEIKDGDEDLEMLNKKDMEIASQVLVMKWFKWIPVYITL